jgi:hypothetical protein
LNWKLDGLPPAGTDSIRAGLLGVHARFLDTPGLEFRRIVRDAFGVIAEEFLKANLLDEHALNETIPLLAQG